MWAASRITFLIYLKFVDVCRALVHEVHFSEKRPAQLLRSQKTLEMNESRSNDGILVFYRIKKFGFKKKLEHFEWRATANFLRSGFSVEIPMEIPISRLGFIDFPIENRSDSSQMCPFCVRKLLTFF